MDVLVPYLHSFFHSPAFIILQDVELAARLIDLVIAHGTKAMVDGWEDLHVSSARRGTQIELFL